MFSENNILSNYLRDLANCTTLLIDQTLREHLQILGERREGIRYVQKWHLRYKTGDIPKTKQSRAKVTRECL